eukprot:7868176-Ditylum_brightwellii.AAC.1
MGERSPWSQRIGFAPILWPQRVPPHAGCSNGKPYERKEWMSLTLGHNSWQILRAFLRIDFTKERS